MADKEGQQGEAHVGDDDDQRAGRLTDGKREAWHGWTPEVSEQRGWG